jgi:tetratricopeptide (TPR) repeat protein
MSSVRFSLLASLAFVALGCEQGRAAAGDIEDCMGPVADKVEAACTAILNDAQRPADDRVKAYFSRSRFFTSRGKLDAGLSDAEAALQLNPQSVGALVSRAYVRQRTGKFDMALADYDRAIELDPKNPSVLTSRGFLRADQKAFPEALANFNQAIALRQDFAQAYVGRGRVDLETGQLDAALADLNAALSMNATVQNGFYWRGQVYRRKGDVDRAIDDFSGAIAQSPQTERAAYYARAQLFTAKGDYARAIADFDRLLSLAPDDRAVQQQRQAAVAMQTELAKVRDTPSAPANCGRAGGAAGAARERFSTDASDRGRAGSDARSLHAGAAHHRRAGSAVIVEPAPRAGRAARQPEEIRRCGDAAQSGARRRSRQRSRAPAARIVADRGGPLCRRPRGHRRGA